MNESNPIANNKEPQQIPPWVKENRLLTDTEIKERKRKFPSKEEEQLLRRLFFDVIRPQVRDFLRELIPDGKLAYSISDIFVGNRRKENLPQNIDQLTDNQIELITAYLYGIYFYNLVSGGRIMSVELNYGQYKKAEEKLRKEMPSRITDPVAKYEYIQENINNVLDSGNLYDWPLKAYSGVFDPLAAAAADTRFNRILIILERFRDISPDENKKVIVRKGRGLFGRGEMSYRTSPRKDWIRTGIEEASHIDFSQLRKMRYTNRTGIQFPKKADYNHGPLKTLGDLAKIKDSIESGDDPNSRVDYDALLAEEFAAHIVQAQYTELYDEQT